MASDCRIRENERRGNFRRREWRAGAAAALERTERGARGVRVLNLAPGFTSGGCRRRCNLRLLSQADERHGKRRAAPPGWRRLCAVEVAREATGRAAGVEETVRPDQAFAAHASSIGFHSLRNRARLRLQPDGRTLSSTSGATTPQSRERNVSAAGQLGVAVKSSKNRLQVHTPFVPNRCFCRQCSTNAAPPSTRMTRLKL